MTNQRDAAEAAARAPRLKHYPDYVDDPDGLARFRQDVKENSGHDTAMVNHNSLGRLIDTIERLRFERDTAIASLPAATEQEPVAWRCFHCGDTFTDEAGARLHFGRDERSEAACVIKAGAESSLLKALRDAEYQADDAIQRMHDESTDAAKAYHQQRCRHTQALIAAEELGYERGLADGRAAPSDQEKLIAELVEALERCRTIVQQHNHRQNEKVEDVVHIVNRALGKPQA